MPAPAASKPDNTAPQAAPPPEAPRVNKTPVASVAIGEFLELQRFSGACDDTTAELFFDHGREQPSVIHNRERAAKAICTLCPILAQCSLTGRADLTLDGVWGGETRKERRAARRRHNGHAIPAVPTGNPAARLRIQQARQHAQRAGIHAAADQLAIPTSTLRRLISLYDLDHQAKARACSPLGTGAQAGG
jgi:WhiB family redox-sensing transcriptional regulator